MTSTFRVLAPCTWASGAGSARSAHRGSRRPGKWPPFAQLGDLVLAPVA